MKMSKFDALRKGGIISLLLGIIAFIFSSVYINYHINPEDEQVKVYLSTYTSFVESQDGTVDTFLLGSKELILEYLDSLESIGDIYLVDLERHHLKQEYSLLADSNVISFDTKKHKVDTTFYFKYSNTLYKTLFYSTNVKKLFETINELDQYSARKVELATNKSRHLLNRYPQILVWALLISIVIGYSFALIPLFIGEIMDLTDGGKDKIWLNYLGLAVLIIFCIFIPLIVVSVTGKNFLFKPADFEPLFHFGIKPSGLNLNSILPFAGTLAWLVLVLCTNRSVLGLSMKIENPKAAMASFVSLRKSFERNFILIAVLMAFGIFCTDILINTLNDLARTKGDYQFFPTQFAFVNGLMQTFILVLIYFVVNGSFQYTKSELVLKGSEEMVKTYKLDQGRKPLDYLKLILTILAPVLGSGIPELIKLIFSQGGT